MRSPVMPRAKADAIDKLVREILARWPDVVYSDQIEKIFVTEGECPCPNPGPISGQLHIGIRVAPDGEPCLFIEQPDGSGFLLPKGQALWYRLHDSGSDEESLHPAWKNWKPRL